MSETPHHQIVKLRQRKNARAMRRIATDAEQKLWLLLRDRRLDGIKFRRQVPFGPYILDFVCFEQKVLIEVDGGQHGASEAAESVTCDCMLKDFRWSDIGTMMC